MNLHDICTCVNVWWLYCTYVTTSTFNFAAGFRCGEYENPADFFLDVLTTCEEASIEGGEVVQKNSGIIIGTDLCNTLDYLHLVCMM